MGEQRHLIKRQVLAFTTTTTEAAQQLQVEMGRIYRQRIVPLIDQYCTALSAPDLLHRIELLELDLGVVDPRHLESDMVSQVRAQLPKLLTAHLDGFISPAASGPDGHAKTSSQLELFSLFVQTGHVPWWADISQPRLIDASLHYLTRHAPAPLRRLMRQWAFQPSALHRIVNHVETETLADLVGALAPLLAPSLPSFAMDLDALLTTTPYAAGRPSVQMRSRVWSTVLQVTSALGQQAQTPLALCRDILSRIARTLGVSNPALLSALRQSVQADTARVHEPFREIVETLYEEMQREGATRDVRLTELLSQWQGQGGWWGALALALQPLTDGLARGAQAQVRTAMHALAQSTSPHDRPTAQRIERFIQTLRTAIPTQRLSPDRLQLLRDAIPTDPTTTGLAELLSQWQGEGGWWGALALALQPLTDGLERRAQAQVRTALHALAQVPSSRDRPSAQRVERFITTLRTAIPTQSLSPDRLQQIQDALTIDTTSTGLAELLSQWQDQGGQLAAFARVLRPATQWLTKAAQLQMSDALRELVRQDTSHDTTPHLARFADVLRHTLIRQQLAPQILRQWLHEVQPQSVTSGGSDGVDDIAWLLQEALQIEPDAQATLAASAVDLRFSDADDLYIGNAGLVILWPFLGHFFGYLDLVRDRQFTSRAAMQKAVGLLQYLATANPHPPEYLLALNKVLCGMELNDVFDIESPMTEAEVEACTDLLTAVIMQAPILNNMSIPGFRGTFLLRQGVLSARDGVWLLRVERETYDVVLDRFPWSVASVKLPWMDTLLQVEW